MRSVRPAFDRLSVALVLLLAGSRPALAVWSSDPHVNTPLCTAAREQDTPVVIADGRGGAIVVWADRRSGNLDVYAQRLSTGGTPSWQPDGVALCTADGDQEGLAVVSDGDGGAIVTWMDTRDSPFDIYAQRISANGTVQWIADGVPICIEPGQKVFPKIVSDGAGGAILGWEDRRLGFADAEIYAARVSAAGVTMWEAGGVAVCPAGRQQQSPVMIPDGTGGALIVWEDGRNGLDADLYAQRISGMGAPQWATNGVGVCTAVNDQFNAAIEEDGSGGAVLAWMDSRGGNLKIYAQKISDAGAPQWAADGVVQCTGVGNERNPTIATDGAGGAIVVWQDERFWNVNGTDLYAQRVSAAGAAQWPAAGVQVCNNIYGDQMFPHTISDGSGGAIVTWQDSRDGGSSGLDVYARKLTAAGSVQWTFSGAPVSTADGNQAMPMLAPDGSGGAIIAWQDSRNGYDDIYSQRILANGALATATTSVPDDRMAAVSLSAASTNPVRGGQMTVRFTLANAAAADLQLLDVVGRQLDVREVGSLGSGTHTLELARARHVAPGVYLVQLRQGHELRLLRMVVLE